MFASRVTKDVETYDGDVLVHVTIQKLSGRSLRKAEEAHQTKALLAMHAASKDMLQVWNSKAIEDAAEKIAEKRAKEANDLKAQTKARYDRHDRDHVLQAGVVRWTAVDKTGAPVPVNDEAFGNLDEDTAQKLHEAILDLSLPPLDPAEAEAALAKD